MIIKFEPTSMCNAACVQCERVNRETGEVWEWLEGVSWTIDEFKKAFPLDQIEKWEMSGTVGDPIMCKDIFEIVQHIIENSDAIVRISTNGSMRTPDWWWDFGVMGGDRLNVTFAIDGVTQEEHEKNRVGTKLSKVVENMEAFSMTKAHTSAFIVQFKHTDFETVKQFCLDHGATDVSFSPAHRFGPIYGEGGEVESPINAWKTLVTEDLDIYCRWKEKDEIYVSAWGTVFPCCDTADRVNPKTNHSTKINIFDVDEGPWLEYRSRLDELNLKKHDFYSIINHELLQSVYENLNNGICKTYCKHNIRKVRD